MDWLPLIKVAIAFILLALASWSDWKTREASDLYWIIIGSLGLVLLGYQIYSDNVDLLYYLFLVPVAVFFYDIFWDRKGMFEDGINIVPLVLYSASFGILALLVAEFGTTPYLWRLMTVPIMIFLFILLYKVNMIKGGADAKALIALAVLFPTYPFIGSLPIIAIPLDIWQYVFPFALLILFNAAILVIVVPLVMIVYNIGKRDLKFPAMLFGYKMSVENAKHKFVWPMEFIENGAMKFSLFPRDSEFTAAQLDGLAAAGVKDIWVTPKIPFLIPITASLLFSTVLGNILLMLFR